MATDEQFDEFVAMLKVTDKEKPAQTDIAKLRTMLAKHPDLANVAGNLATQAKIQVIDHALGYKKGAAICCEERYDQMRTELGYAGASAIERSLMVIFD